MILAIIIAILSLLIAPSLVLATDTPIQISPVDNSTITQSKPKLTWQYSGNCPIDTKISCFRVELDTFLLFPNPKYNYTNSFSYNPQTLTDGKWYWRVKAKDTSEIWSSWSTIWSFTLTAASPSPSPTSTPTPTPKPTTTPTPKSTTKLSPSPTPTPTSIPAPTHTPTSTFTPATKSEGPSFAWARRIASSASRIASVAGAQTSTPEGEVEVKNQKQTSSFIWVGLIFIFAGAGLIGYIYFKKNAKI